MNAPDQVRPLRDDRFQHGKGRGVVVGGKDFGRAIDNRLFPGSLPRIVGKAGRFEEVEQYILGMDRSQRAGCENP